MIFPINELEWFDAAHHELDNAIGFFFYHALHHHTAISHDKHIDEESEDETCSDSYFSIGGGSLSLFVPLHCGNTNISIYVVDDFVQFWHTRGGKFVLAHLLIDLRLSHRRADLPKLLSD